MLCLDGPRAVRGGVSMKSVLSGWSGTFRENQVVLRIQLTIRFRPIAKKRRLSVALGDIG
jgi:hypothetical protein